MFTRTIALTWMVFAAAQPATADAIADFYKGKTVTIAVGHEVGTGFDIYARALQRHMRRHIPGNPGIVVQTMNGAGGVISANWLYNVAPKDGTAIGSFVYTVPFEPLLGNDKALYEPARFTWIGNMEEGVTFCGLSRAAGIDKFEDLRTKEAIFGGAAQNGALLKSALAVRNLLGVKVKVVPGYRGAASIKLAIARGELHGICSMSVSTLAVLFREEYESGSFRPIIQLSGRTRPIAGLPHVDDYTRSEDDRQVFGLIFGAQALGRLFAAPPSLPAAHRDALRAAFDATMKDPEFLADAAKTQIDISPMTGQDVEAYIAKLSTASAAVIERVKQAYLP